MNQRYRLNYDGYILTVIGSCRIPPHLHELHEVRMTMRSRDDADRTSSRAAERTRYQDEARGQGPEPPGVPPLRMMMTTIRSGDQFFAY